MPPVPPSISQAQYIPLVHTYVNVRGQFWPKRQHAMPVKAFRCDRCNCSCILYCCTSWSNPDSTIYGVPSSSSYSAGTSWYYAVCTDYRCPVSCSYSLERSSRFPHRNCACVCLYRSESSFGRRYCSRACHCCYNCNRCCYSNCDCHCCRHHSCSRRSHSCGPHALSPAVFCSFGTFSGRHSRPCAWPCSFGVSRA